MKTIIIDGVEYNLTPKAAFREGDWVVNTITNDVEQIIDVTSNEYICTGLLIVSFDNHHLLKKWSIQDAKDGDVLVTEDWVFIFKKMNSNGKPVCYCHYDIELGFRIDTNSYMASGSEIYPATKEQRDLLFQKMKEAGYEWDAEKKELKKIEQNPAWSEEDEREVAVLEAYIRSKDWSERHIDRALGIVDELVNKAKSLRPPYYCDNCKLKKSIQGWKPSDEQMDAVESAALDVSKFSSRSEQLRLENEPYYKALVSLYNDLEKLREE